MGQPYIGIHDADGNQLLPIWTWDDSTPNPPIIVEKFEATPPSVRDQSDNRSQASGIIDRTAFTGSAGVTLEGVFCEDALGGAWSYADQLKALSTPDQRIYFHVQRADWDQPRRILVRGDTPTSAYSDFSPAFQFQYKSPTGEFEAIAEESPRVFPLGTAEPGFSEPFSEPLYVEAGGAAGGTLLKVDGSRPCLPVVDLYGAANGLITIQNLSYGEIWQSKPTAAVEAGHFWRIDFDNHTVLVDGDPAIDRYDQFDFLGSSWWKLRRGVNEVSLTVQQPGAGCQALLRYRPRYAI